MGADSQGEPGLDDLIRRIEDIVRMLDSDSLELDDALALFEEGVRDVGRARKILARTELRIEELIGTEERADQEPAPPDGTVPEDGEDA